MRILIADDDPTSRTLLTAVLRKRGHDLVEARDGVEALAILQGAAPPRIVILDWLMPGIDGVEICRRVRTATPSGSPYLIMLTTRDGPADVSAGLGAGANDYVAKPFSPAELVARVEVGCRFVALEDRYTAKVHELEDALARLKALQGGGSAPAS